MYLVLLAFIHILLTTSHLFTDCNSLLMFLDIIFVFNKRLIDVDNVLSSANKKINLNRLKYFLS